MKKAIQLGAGNIGRGFIGSLLHQSGYHVVFADVVAKVVDKINEDTCRLELGPDNRAQPHRIKCRICHLNGRGITFNLSNAAGGIQRQTKSEEA